MFSLFGNKAAVPESWLMLDHEAQLDKITEESHQTPVVIFKHSTSCSRSAFAKHKLEAAYDGPIEDFKFYYLDLLSHRGISNMVASRFGIQHQSPQIIVVKNGIATYNTSHENINAKRLQEHI